MFKVFFVRDKYASNWLKLSKYLYIFHYYIVYTVIAQYELYLELMREELKKCFCFVFCSGLFLGLGFSLKRQMVEAKGLVVVCSQTSSVDVPFLVTQNSMMADMSKN